MAEIPTLIAEVGFSAALTGTALHLGDAQRGILGTNTLGAANLFVDVTEYATSVTTFRGARRADGPVTQYETGNATARLDNSDRRFDPTNLDGPYVSAGATQVEPMRAVRFRATWNGVTYPLWRGFTDLWSVGYEPGNTVSWASVTCFDAFGVFAAHSRGASSSVGASETTGARIGRVLDGINWPDGDRVISDGVETVQATTLEGAVLSEMQLNADTELGELWMDAQGRVVFRDREAPYSDFRSAYPLAHFGDQEEAGDTTINLATNPSAENGLTGWAGGGFVAPTVSQSSAQARFGTYSVLATWPNATSSDLPLVEYTVSGLTPGKRYTFSLYAYVPTGSPSVALIIATTGPWGTSTGDTKDDWVRLTLTTTVNTDSPLLQIWPYNSTTTAGQTVYLDGLQIEEGSTVTDYVDGDQTGCEWDGLSHQSTSRRLPELPANDVQLVNDALSIINHVSATREGGTEQTAQNAASVSKYLTRSYPRTGLLHESDAETLIWAEQIVARTATPEQRVASVTLKPTRDERLWPYALGLEIGDRIRVTKRPPGGGDPIVREAWIRGIEHQAAATQEWQTVFVLEQALDADVVSATFGTNAATGWSDTDTGQSWSNTGATSSAFAVSGGSGRHIHSSTNNLLRSLVEAGSANVRVQVDLVNPSQPTGAAITEWAVARAADVNNYYTAQLSISTGNVVTLGLFKRVGGALTGLTSAAIGSTSAGQTWRLILDAAGTTVRAKAWRPGVDSEPGWQRTTTDSSLTSGTQAGVMTRLESGNTNTQPYTIFVDNFSATTLHAWT